MQALFNNWKKWKNSEVTWVMNAARRHICSFRIQKLQVRKRIWYNSKRIIKL